MSKGKSSLKKKRRGQAMVEFVIALPILLFIIFGIIEFARMIFAWMAVQNAARFGIRYAVTGEFNDIYCVEAGNYFGAAHITADTDGGDPQDCLIPDSYTGLDKNDKERELIDMARLFSVQDAAIGGGSGLWLRPNVSGNYEQYLNMHNEAFIGLPNETGFYHITICSNRESNFSMDYGNYSIPLCKDIGVNQLMDDAGGPGDRVKVRVEHRHPLFLPLLSNLWPSVTLNAERDGIVEKFRTSRSLGVTGPILSAPTWTQTPTKTLSPTITNTPTDTATPLPTNTPIPVNCDLITILDADIATNAFNTYSYMIIQNTNPVPIHLIRADQGWTKDLPTRTLAGFQFYLSPLYVDNDSTPPSAWVPPVPIEVPIGVIAQYNAVFLPGVVPLSGATSIDLEFDDGCHKIVNFNHPSATPSDTPTATATPTITPTPDCSKYTMTGFTFTDFALQHMFITNGDVVDADVNQVQFNWNYAEALGNTNGYNSLNVDWFSWNGSYFQGGGEGPPQDPNSPTNWTSGLLPFNAGSTYKWEIDFDGDWGGGGPLTGVVSNDFGVIIDFANGCQLRRDPVPRSVVTWTPSPTPTSTWTPTPPPPTLPPPPPTFTYTATATPLPSFTPSDTWTPTITLTPSDTLTPSYTPSKTNTPITPSITNTSIPTDTFTPSPTSKTPSVTPSPVPSFTPSPTWNTD